MARAGRASRAATSASTSRTLTWLMPSAMSRPRSRKSARTLSLSPVRGGVLSDRRVEKAAAPRLRHVQFCLREGLVRRRKIAERERVPPYGQVGEKPVVGVADFTGPCRHRHRLGEIPPVGRLRGLIPEVLGLLPGVATRQGSCLAQSPRGVAVVAVPRVEVDERPQTHDDERAEPYSPLFARAPLRTTASPLRRRPPPRPILLACCRGRRAPSARCPPALPGRSAARSRRRSHAARTRSRLIPSARRPARPSSWPVAPRLRRAECQALPEGTPRLASGRRRP